MRSVHSGTQWGGAVLLNRSEACTDAVVLLSLNTRPLCCIPIPRSNMHLAPNAVHLARCQRHRIVQSSLLAPPPAAALSWIATCCCSSSSSNGGWGVNPTSSCRSLSVLAAAAAGAQPSQRAPASTHHPLIDWVQRNGGAVNGIGVANLAGSDGGSGWGLVASQVRSQAGVLQLLRLGFSSISGKVTGWGFAASRAGV
jgi:hypothetical protein